MPKLVSVISQYTNHQGETRQMVHEWPKSFPIVQLLTEFAHKESPSAITNVTVHHKDDTSTTFILNPRE